MWPLIGKFKQSATIMQQVAIARKLVDNYTAELSREQLIFYLTFLECFK